MLIPPGIWYWCIARFLLVPILDCGIAASSQLDSQHIAHLKLTPLPDVHRSSTIASAWHQPPPVVFSSWSFAGQQPGHRPRGPIWVMSKKNGAQHCASFSCRACCKPGGWQGNVRRGIAKMRGKNACVWEVIGDSSSVRATYANTTWQLCTSRHLRWHLGPQLLTACCHSDLA